jgi:phosphatidylglycerophosphate synthase
MTFSNTLHNALLIAINPQYRSIVTDVLYGGETLLNRCMIAMSKSGIQSVVIVAAPGTTDKIKEMIRTVDHRLNLKYEVTELQQGQILSDKIRSVASGWNKGFLMYEADKFMHPTFLQQVVKFGTEGKAVLAAHKDVMIKEGQLIFDPAFKEKFKIIFANPAGFNKITLGAVEPSIFASNPLSLTKANPRTLFTNPGDGIICSDVIVCSKEVLDKVPEFNSLDDGINKTIDAGLAAVAFVKDAWWLRITPAISKSHIKEMIWKIAFKEISGEFSKAVNSKFSKPLSFYFARKGVSPNTLSNAQIILFLIASCFLLINAHWATILFAVIWQFSAGVLDRCDGEVARIRNYESEKGGRFDMIVDDLRNGLPFVFLGSFFYFQSQDSLYLISTIFTAIWFSTMTLAEQKLMRKAGYTSRQRLYHDYLEFKGEQSQTTTMAKKYVRFISGDIRTFYVSLVAVFGFKETAYWMLCIYLTVIPIYLVLGGLKFMKEISKSDR